MHAQPHSLWNTFIALDAGSGARPLPVGDSFWGDLEAGRLGDFTRMVSAYEFSEDWSTWEMHPAGEEVVMLLQGDVCLRLEREGGAIAEVRLSEPGCYVLVPRGTWHTARTRSPAKMLFITFGEGTQHRPVNPPTMEGESS